jgi:membrane protein
VRPAAAAPPTVRLKVSSRSRKATTSSSERAPAPVEEPGAAVNASAPPERRGTSDRRRPVRIRSPHDETWLEAFADFSRRVYKKADQDQIFFMAGAIAFNVLVAIIPLLLATLGITGQILQKRMADPEAVLLRYLLQALPPVSQAFEVAAQGLITKLLENASRFTIIGIVLLVWVSTRLVGTLRAALKEVFDVGFDRNIILGKLFDIKMVVAAGALFTVNVGLTVVADIVNKLMEQFGQRYGLQPMGFIQGLYVELLAIISAWVMFLLIYRYLPYRRIHWRTAVYAATFTTIFFELLKRAFGWYVSSVANYGTTYGNVANLIILFLWVYYIAIIFILGGEVGQVAALRRIRRQQKERLG